MTTQQTMPTRDTVTLVYGEPNVTGGGTPNVVVRVDYRPMLARTEVVFLYDGGGEVGRVGRLLPVHPPATAGIEQVTEMVSEMLSAGKGYITRPRVLRPGDNQRWWDGREYRTA